LPALLGKPLPRLYALLSVCGLLALGACAVKQEAEDTRERAMRDIDPGITYINGPTIGAEVHLPFGGVKDTGNGHREAGTTVYDIFTEWKSIYVDYSGKLQKAQIDNAD